MNIVAEINKVYTYAQIARRIEVITGRNYSEGHIGNVARGTSAINDRLMYNLERAFPEFFAKRQTIDEQNLTKVVNSY